MSDLNLYQRINKVMLEIEGVRKGARITMANGSSYTAVAHDDVTFLLHTPIAKAGIVILTSVIDSKMDILEKEKEYKGVVTKSREYMANVTVEVTAVNMDKPEERTSVKMPAIAFDSSDKAFGKSISMATKYALLKLFMLDSYDDEEKRPEAGTSYSNNQSTGKPAPPQYAPKKETFSQTMKREAEAECPTPEIEKRPGPDYRFPSGKFVGMQMKDVDKNQLENYRAWFEKQINLGPKQKELLHSLTQFLDNYEIYREEMVKA